MRIIVINDSDGHTWAIAHTPENVAKVAKAAIERGGVTEADLKDEPTGLPVGRRWGNMCEVIDVANLSEFPRSNPFT